MTRLLLILFCLVVAASPLRAENMRYYSDPVYKKLAEEDTHPMDAMLELAQEGDARAMFILGDMYAKGKGGLAKNEKDARQWFNNAALHGYTHAFMRLAAMAKRDKKPLEAWQWYTLAMDEFDRGGEQKFAVAARNELIEKAELTSADFSEGRAAIREWRSEQSRILREERAAERIKQQQDDAAARLAAKQEQQDKKSQKEMHHDQD